MAIKSIARVLCASCLQRTASYEMSEFKEAGARVSGAPTKISIASKAPGRRQQARCPSRTAAKTHQEADDERDHRPAAAAARLLAVRAHTAPLTEMPRQSRRFRGKGPRFSGSASDVAQTSVVPALGPSSTSTRSAPRSRRAGRGRGRSAVGERRQGCRAGADIFCNRGCNCAGGGRYERGGIYITWLCSRSRLGCLPLTVCSG